MRWAAAGERMAHAPPTHDGPATGTLAYWLGRLWLWAAGWQVEGHFPPGVTRAVVIAAPHTSNWDLPHMLAASFVFRLRLSWMGKHTLFRPPFGAALRWLGGVPVDRRAPQGLVRTVAATLRDADRLALAIPPSGTRKRAASWKSGFYWIAVEAGVPIVCGYLDYRQRRAGLGHLVWPTGDPAADMAAIRAFYEDKRGKFPDQETPVVLKEEGGPAAGASAAP
jgi:1-acyl-sn-glycerol-3-phosphate acyltransferase